MRRSWAPERARASRALEALAWRGPDGLSLVEAGDWFLGIARLAITDPGAPQPIRCPATGRLALLNGAVTSAAREWREAGGEARTRNDAELALHRLRRGGARLLGATCGPYALAVLDPATDELWLARDPEGEKPLFVLTRGAQVVAFASGVMALRALGLDVRLDAENVARLLRYGFALGPSLALPGHRLHADLRGVWVARPGAALAPVEGTPPPEAQDGGDLRARVAGAVARCAAAEVRVGLSLSGGVDSSCLAAALRCGGKSVPAYQLCARGAPTDERARARRVAAHTGHELRPVDAGPEVLRALPALTRATGLPQGDPSVLAAHALARVARRDGVAVLLSGEGADDLWLGYRRHRAAALLPARGVPAVPAPALANGTGARLLRALRAPVPYDALLEVAPPAFRRAVLTPELLAAGALPAPAAREASLARARYADRAFYLRHDLLPKCDTALMAAGVEGRCPYLDPAILASPETRAARLRPGKRALKAAFARDLPSGILAQRKRGFGLPLDRWLREDDFVADVLRDPRTRTRPHLRAAGVGAMLDRHRAGRADLGHALYLVAALELWLRVLEDAP